MYNSDKEIGHSGIPAQGCWNSMCCVPEYMMPLLVCRMHGDLGAEETRLVFISTSYTLSNHCSLHILLFQVAKKAK